MFKLLSLFGLFVYLFFACTSSEEQKKCDCPPFVAMETTVKQYLKDLKTHQQDFDNSLQTLFNAKNKICTAHAHELLSRAYYSKNNLDSAELFANRALVFLNNQNCANDLLLSVYKDLNNVHSNRAEFAKCVEWELKINEIVALKRDTPDLAMSFLSLSNVFNRVHQEEKGLFYCRKAIPLISALNNSSIKAQLFTRAAQRYLYGFEQLNDPSLLDTSALYAQEAYNIMLSTPVERPVKFSIQLRLSAIANKKKEFGKALNYIDENLKISDRNKDFSQLAVSFSDRAEILMLQKQFKQARFWADSALFYQKKTQSPPHIANVYNLLYKIAKEDTESKTALWAYENEKRITDSLDKLERTTAVSELEKKYNQAKNEKTIKELAQEKSIYLLLTLMSVLVGLIIIFSLRQTALKHKQKILETEQRLNRARMNPHFFFNALTSLQSFALRENDGRILATNLSKFSNIMRETLESTYKEYVTIEQEMDFLNEYLEIQKIRFPKKFSYAIHADADLDVEDLAIPSMIIQPFVENSIEHGFVGLPHEGHVDIHFSKKGKEVLVTISDNGNGLGQLPTLKNEHISRASQIIKDRIYLLNLKLKTTARFSIDNKTAEKGVLVLIYLPLIDYEKGQNG